MFVQAVKVKGLFALICCALWSRVGAGEGQLPWRWAVVGRHWGLSSEQTALYKSSMWPTTWNSPIFVSDKSRNTMHRRSKQPQCSLGAKSSANRKPESLWAFEGGGEVRMRRKQNRKRSRGSLWGLKRSHLHNECTREVASVGTETGASHAEAPR